MTSLEVALGRLLQNERRGLVGGLVQVRNARAEAGDARLAEVYSELLCLVIEANEAEDELMSRLGQEVLDSVIRVVDDVSNGRQP